MTRRERRQKSVTRVDALTHAEAVAAAKGASSEDRLQLTALITWVGYSCPDTTTVACSAVISVWLGTGVPAPEIPKGLPEARLEDSFCRAAPN